MKITEEFFKYEGVLSYDKEEMSRMLKSIYGKTLKHWDALSCEEKARILFKSGYYKTNYWYYVLKQRFENVLVDIVTEGNVHNNYLMKFCDDKKEIHTPVAIIYNKQQWIDNIKDVEPSNNYFDFKSKYRQRWVETYLGVGVLLFEEDITGDFKNVSTNNVYLCVDTAGMKKFTRQQRKNYDGVLRVKNYDKLVKTTTIVEESTLIRIDVPKPEPAIAHLKAKELTLDDFVEKRVSCHISGKFIDNALLVKEGYQYFILQNIIDGAEAKDKRGFLYSYSITTQYGVEYYDIKVLEEPNPLMNPLLLPTVDEIDEDGLAKEKIKEKKTMENVDVMELFAEQIKEKMGIDNINEAKIQNIVKEEVKKYYIPKKVEIINYSKEIIDVGVTHAKFKDLLKLVEKRLDTFLVGQAGSGKTTLCSQIAKCLELPFYFIPVGLQTTKSDLLGYMDATGKYIQTHLRNAYENGGVFLLDEIDAGNPNVLTVINAMLSNGHASFPDKIIERHENFIFIGAGNTYGFGGDIQYVGRNQLDAATLDRFVMLEINYDKALESHMCDNDDWLTTIWKIRDAVKKLNEKVIVSPRASLKGKMMLDSGFSKEEVKRMVVYKGINEEIVKRIEAEIARS